MNRLAFTDARILAPDGFVDGHALVIEDGRVIAVTPVDELDAGLDRIDLGGGMLVPGFIDTQVNGGGGVLFNAAPTVETIAAIGRAHRQYGTTGFLPTLISDDLSVIRSGIAAVDAAIAAGVPGVLGIHVEGPFLSEHRKGIHHKEKLRRLDEEGFAVLTSLGSGRTLVTVAPECTTPEMIGRLVAAGVRVSAGHTNGSYTAVSDAIDKGLTGITHLFNAMSPLGNRDPGTVGAALESDRTWCGIIVDGHHVSPITLRLALRCKPAERFMLVTDAMPTVGSDVKEFELQGRWITAHEGVCVDEGGTLAGSDLDMATAVRNSVSMLGVDLRTAICMGSAAPAAFLGLDDLGSLKTGARASMVLLDDDLSVRRSWIDGETE